MSTADLLGTAGRPVGDKPDLEKKLFRIAGLGAVGALVAWAGQPIMVTLAAQGEGGGEVTDWAGVESAKWSGAVEVVIFSGIGLGMLFFVLATWQLLRLRLGGPSIAAQAGMTGGVVGAVAWFLTAAESFRMYTSIGAGIPDAVPDSNLQKAVIEGTALDITGALILFQVAYTAWLVLLATAGRKARVVGLPVTALIGLSFLGVIVQLAVPFLPPWPMAGYLLVTLATGISFLIKSRR
jgi:hypothetical protein